MSCHARITEKQLKHVARPFNSHVLFFNQRCRYNTVLVLLSVTLCPTWSTAVIYYIVTDTLHRPVCFFYFYFTIYVHFILLLSDKNIDIRAFSFDSCGVVSSLSGSSSWCFDSTYLPHFHTLFLHIVILLKYFFVNSIYTTSIPCVFILEEGSLLRQRWQ